MIRSDTAPANWPAPTPIRRRTPDCMVQELADGTFVVGVGHVRLRVPPMVLAAIFADAS